MNRFDRLRALTGAPRFGHQYAGISPDGHTLAYVSDRFNGVDFDLWLCDLDRGAHRLLHAGGAWYHPASGFSPDGRFVSVLRPGARPLDVDLVLVEVSSGEARVPIAHPDEAALIGSPAWLSGRVFYAPSNVGRQWFLEPPIVSAGRSRLYYTLSTPRLAGDVYSHDLTDGETRRLTHSRSECAPDALAAPELGAAESFDGEQIPLFIFQPRSNEPRPPVVVKVHGGPEAQAMQLFDPEVQALVTAGYAVVVPNVRGSTGYGKRYASLDDTTKRLDSVRDLRSVHAALESLGFDPGRAVLWGGSYGGYMTLAGLAFHPELWAAGVEIVGISNLIAFLENTSEYRRAHREREYGSLTSERDFLHQASPLTHVEAIRAPLFVIHGRNDPRVPLSEAQQLVASLARRGVEHELLIYDDEGHGLARLANQLDAYPRAIQFLDRVLGR